MALKADGRALTATGIRPRRRRRRLGLRWLRERAAPGREGLPRRTSTRPAGGSSDEDFAKTSWDLRRYLWAPTPGLLRRPAHPPAARRHGPRRRGRRRRVAELRQHPLRAAGAVLRATRSGATSPTGRPSWRPTTRRPPRHARRGRPTRATARSRRSCAGRPTDLGRRRHVPQDAGRGLLRRRRGRAASPDPYFGGAGPDRTGCTQCGNCMVGCRVGAKNTLVKNYLALAERRGVTHRAAAHRDRGAAGRPGPAGAGLPRDDRAAPGRGCGTDRRTVTAAQVVLAAGTWGTQRLLHTMRDRGGLPRLSPRLGHLTRTNSEALGGAMTARRARGRRPDPRGRDHRRPSTPTPTPTSRTCRYGTGSNAMGALADHPRARRRPGATTAAVRSAQRRPPPASPSPGRCRSGAGASAPSSAW